MKKFIIIFSQLAWGMEVFDYSSDSRNSKERSFYSEEETINVKGLLKNLENLEYKKNNISFKIAFKNLENFFVYLDDPDFMQTIFHQSTDLLKNLPESYKFTDFESTLMNLLVYADFYDIIKDPRKIFLDLPEQANKFIDNKKPYTHREKIIYTLFLSRNLLKNIVDYKFLATNFPYDFNLKADHSLILYNNVCQALKQFSLEKILDKRSFPFFCEELKDFFSSINQADSIILHNQIFKNNFKEFYLINSAWRFSNNTNLINFFIGQHFDSLNELHKFFAKSLFNFFIFHGNYFGLIEKNITIKNSKKNFFLLLDRNFYDINFFVSNGAIFLLLPKKFSPTDIILYKLFKDNFLLKSLTNKYLNPQNYLEKQTYDGVRTSVSEDSFEDKERLPMKKVNSCTLS